MFTDTGIYVGMARGKELQVVAASRGTGKSMITQQSILDLVKHLYNYTKILKTFTHRKTKKIRHIVTLPLDARNWLEKEYSQFGKSDPDWFYTKGVFNIEDKMLSIVMLKYG